MKCRSIFNPQFTTTLEEAVMGNGGTTHGLLLPETFPKMPRAVINNLWNMSMEESGFIVLSSILGKNIPADAISEFAKGIAHFDFPISKTPNENVFSIDLNGTGAGTISDFSATLHLSIIRYLSGATQHGDKRINIVTCGSDNASVSMAKHVTESDCINMFILCSQKEAVSLLADTGINHKPNIKILAVPGTTSDVCNIYTSLLADSEFTKKWHVTTGGTSNTAGFIPLIIPYFSSVANLAHHVSHELRCATILTDAKATDTYLAGRISSQMGLPVICHTITGGDTLYKSANTAFSISSESIAIKPPLSKEQAETLYDNASTQCPVVIVTEPTNVAYPDHTLRDHSQHQPRIVRSVTALKKIIEQSN